MKKTALISIILVLMTFVDVDAQARWEFPISFTDATGVSDTVWFIQQDSNADYDCAHSKYTILDPQRETFCVYTMKHGDTIWKTHTHSFANDFYDELIFADNCEFPVTISWNRSLFDTIIGNHNPIWYAKIENMYTSEHDLEGNLIFDYYGWYILHLETTGPQPPYDENDLYNWNIFNALYALDFFPMSLTLLRHHAAIEEHEDQSMLLNVYPNPNEGFLKLTLLSDKDQKAYVSLCNLQGVIVKNLYDGLLLSGENRLSFDINDVSKGCYLIKVSTDTKACSFVKIIKTL